jgi:hypothetical protein
MDISKLNTKRLLALYRSKRKQHYNKFYENYFGATQIKEEYKNSMEFINSEKELEEIKQLLNTRNHVGKSN